MNSETERLIGKNVMVTIGLRNVDLPYKDKNNQRPVLPVHYNEHPQNILDRFTWGSLGNTIDDNKNFIVGFEESMVVAQLPVNKEMYSKYLETDSSGTPFGFIRWLQNTTGIEHSHIPYYKK